MAPPQASLSPETVRRAVVALQKYTGQNKESATSLLDDDNQLIYLQIVLKKKPATPGKLKPQRIPLPHPLWNLDDNDICLIVKDRDDESKKAAKKRLAEENKSGVNKVVGVSQLRKKYEAYEAKRALCKQYDLFLADDRVIPMLPRLLGKFFLKRKKQPIPVNLASRNWSAEIDKAVGATYMLPASGQSLGIKVARTAFAVEGAVENVLAVMEAAVEKIPKKWSNVQAVFLKTADSVALPLMQSLPEDTSSRIALAPPSQPAAKAPAEAFPPENGAGPRTGKLVKVAKKKAAAKKVEVSAR